MNNNLSKNGEARRGRAASELRPKKCRKKVDWCRSVLVSLREVERGIARRPCHGHVVRSKRERAIEGVLYALTELLPLRGLIPGVSHRPATLHDPLLEASERPADAALRDAEAEHGGAVGRILLRVAHQFERDGPGLRNGDEGETALAKDCFAARHFGAGSRRRRSDRTCVLAGCDKVENKIGAKASQRVGVITHSSSQGSAISA